MNTTVSQNEVKLNDLTLDDVLKTEKANDVTDAGGIAGNNAGVLRACINAEPLATATLAIMLAVLPAARPAMWKAA